MSEPSTDNYELPSKIEKILASLEAYYRNNNKILQRVLVNSEYHIKVGMNFDNWNGGQHGHDIYFLLPPVIYNEIIDDIDKLTTILRDKINSLSNVDNEFINDLYFELKDDPSLDNWRENSDVFIHGDSYTVDESDDKIHEIWKPNYFRLFISHRAEFKKSATSIKLALDYYGVSGFVAHEDIKPTREWQNEIERALHSMDALLALMDSDFSKSEWTDQEIGASIGKRLPIVSVNLGMDPYGFIGKYQTLKGIGKTATNLAKEIYDLLWEYPRLTERLKETLVARFEKSEDFYHANDLIKLIDLNIKEANPNLIARLEKAPENNGQIRGATEVISRLPMIIMNLKSEE